MLDVIYAECYVQAFSIMQSSVMLSVILLNVIMLSVVMLNVEVPLETNLKYDNAKL